MFEKSVAAQKQGTRFVHYTHAEAAMNILRSEEVWMRKSSCMNDFTEVQHGLDCLVNAYRGDIGDRFKATLEGLFPGISSEIEELFNGWIPHLQSKTYFTCVSEHIDSEDNFGRLSMWRAYGGTTGVALVLNNAPFLNESNALKAYTSPVACLSDVAFEQEFAKIADGVEANSEFLRGHDRELVATYVFNSFRFAALCAKHPVFQEEKEWRVIYCPPLDKSDRLVRDIKIIGGVPQPIYKIPLKNIPEEGLVGLEVHELIDRIIIGPTDYPFAIFEAFVDLLAEAGVDKAANRVIISGVPLRE